MSNIKHVVEMSKIVGTVDLSLLQKKVKETPKLKFVMWRTFPLKNYESLLELVKTINRKIGKDSVSISKIARSAGEVLPDKGSILYSCGSKEFMEFKSAYILFELGIRMNLKMITGVVALSLPKDSILYMAYMKGEHVEVVKNVIIESRGEGIWYCAASDKRCLWVYCVDKSDISGNTFDTGVYGETGYFFMDK